MLLFDDVAQLFFLASQDTNTVAGIVAISRDCIGAALVNGNFLRNLE